MAKIASNSVGAGYGTSEDYGDLILNVFTFDLANRAYTPLAIANGDQLQIGVVPANEVLVPHLCLLLAPIVDTNGAPTATYTVGTDASTAALKGSTAGQTAQVLSGEDWTLTNPIGDSINETPIYVKLTAAIATQAATGKFVFHQVTRPWISSFDGQTLS